MRATALTMMFAGVLSMLALTNMPAPAETARPS
jgi:hypothetical protein